MKYDILCTFRLFPPQKNMKVNPFSDFTILWRLFGEYEPSSVLYCYCLRLSCWIGAYGPKIGQNCMKYDFRALFDHFHFKKIEMNPFSGRTILWRPLKEYEPYSRYSHKLAK